MVPDCMQHSYFDNFLVQVAVIEILCNAHQVHHHHHRIILPSIVHARIV